jgi:omega-amidase
MSPLTITLIQTSLHWEDSSANRQMLENKIRSLAHGTQLVVLPEMFSTGFSMRAEALAETMEGETIQWMKALAAEKKIILTGSLIIKEKGNYFNRLAWVLPDGNVGVYDKRHLFAYAEENKYYKAGNKRLIASVNDWKINLLICYDLRFPVWSRQSPLLRTERGTEVEAEYDLLVYVANWPERRIQAWKTLLPARAIENQCYVIGVNRVGDDGKGIHYNGESMVVDPLGHILYSKKDEEDIFTISLHKSQLLEVRRKFPFLHDADRFDIND